MQHIYYFVLTSNHLTYFGYCPMPYTGIYFIFLIAVNGSTYQSVTDVLTTTICTFRLLLFNLFAFLNSTLANICIPFVHLSKCTCRIKFLQVEFLDKNT